MIRVTQDDIDATSWRKTDYISPHEYIVKGKCPQKLFDMLAKDIRDHGIVEYFKGTPYKYLRFGDYKYWHMGIIINRALIVHTQPGSNEESSQQDHHLKLP